MPLVATRGAASAQGFGEFAQQSSVVQANAIDYDGTADYLSRSGSLTGSSASKTFTFSCWMWLGPQTAATYPRLFKIGVDNTTFFEVIWTGYASGTGNIWVQAATSATQNLNWQITPNQQYNNTWINLLISCDMTNTANRSVYINDISQGTGGFSIYNNATLPFNTATQYVAYDPVNVNYYRGRISNLFLDLTYRDLSITANRRLFITADLKPAAGQAALNPILYLPMSDPTQPGLNQGTGGNFTLTGVVARSGRGPNQYNAPYSDLDGAADYLDRTTAPTGIADGKQFTFSVCINIDTLATNPIFVIATSTTTRLYINIDNGSGDIDIGAYNSSGTLIFRAQAASGTLVAGRNYQFVGSFDLSSTSKRYVYLNGQALAMTYPTYLDQNINFAITSTPVYRVGRSASTTYSNAKLGALWFNTSYIDLSVAANLAKFVTGTGIDAKPVDLGANGELPTGTSPLIYLPMYGNNAGKNYGTGGDFTVNSGPYTGARGPNEFWGNKADFDGTTGYLSRTSALSGVSDGKTFSVSFYFMPDSSASLNYLFRTSTSGGDYTFFIRWDGASNTMDIRATGNAGSPVVLTVNSFNNITAGGTYSVQCSVDLTNTAKRALYVNGVSSASSWTTYTNANIGLSAPNVKFSDPVGYFNGRLSEFYFTTDYIDFSQEANRLKFRDAFGNPVDLTQQIQAAAIPNPAIYMRFPPTSFGTNSGTGGNFTVNGTITDGGQL